VRPDSGVLSIFGNKVARFTPRYADALGVRTAFQEMINDKQLTA
jgi:ABC-type sugar transport system ATPase subunit